MFTIFFTIFHVKLNRYIFTVFFTIFLVKLNRYIFTFFTSKFCSYFFPIQNLLGRLIQLKNREKFNFRPKIFSKFQNLVAAPSENECVCKSLMTFFTTQLFHLQSCKEIFSFFPAAAAFLQFFSRSRSFFTALLHTW